MQTRFLAKYYPVVIIGAVVFLFLIGYSFGSVIWEWMVSFYHFLGDREKIKEVISNAGPLAPAVFIMIQFLQVIFAPIPGEATGFIGGYLFGVTKSFIYSSIALAAGSWINFTIARYFGKRFVEKLIPKKQMDRLNTFVRHQGIIVSLIFFIFPGFPKDSLCLFLGLTSIPFKAFIIMASFGRMPGTLMLSVQGAFLYDQMYGFLFLVIFICLAASLLMYRYRDEVYRWIEKLNNGSG